MFLGVRGISVLDGTVAILAPVTLHISKHLLPLEAMKRQLGLKLHSRFMYAVSRMQVFSALLNETNALLLCYKNCRPCIQEDQKPDLSKLCAIIVLSALALPAKLLPPASLAFICPKAQTLERKHVQYPELKKQPIPAAILGTIVYRTHFEPSLEVTLTS